MTSISAELLAYYEATDYCVLAPQERIVTRIGQQSAALAALHADMRVQCSAMVTAWDPYSQPRSLEENRAANRALAAELVAAGYAVLPAEGADPQGQHAPEPGFFVAGMDEAAALECGRRHRQNAIVFAGADAVPRLGLCV